MLNMIWALKIGLGRLGENEAWHCGGASIYLQVHLPGTATKLARHLG